MACPTCDHTMMKVGEAMGESLFWCARCGTIKTQTRLSPDGKDEVAAPVLVGRCRQFEEEVVGRECSAKTVADVWRRRGVQESINTPENRRGT